MTKEASQIVKSTLKYWVDEIKKEQTILKKGVHYIQNLSKYYNQIYIELQKSALDQQKLSKITAVLKKKIIRNLKEGFRKGMFYKGSLQHKFLLQDPSLKSLRSKAARKRGHTFEVLVKQSLKQYFQQKNEKGYVFKVPCGRFGNQPFDLIVFRTNQCFLLECKAGGVLIKKNGEKILESCSRRYNCYSKVHSKIIGLRETQTPYFFVLRTKSELEVLPLITIVPEPLINQNLNKIYTKNVQLDQSNSITLYEDPLHWPKDLWGLMTDIFNKSTSRTL